MRLGLVNPFSERCYMKKPPEPWLYQANLHLVRLVGMVIAIF